uniref:Uncharacterized protein n=1 Tax=Anopheles merus TaxID=30066 RepID=A0A182VM56_ANOME
MAFWTFAYISLACIALGYGAAANMKPLCEWMRTIYKTYFYEELAKVSNFPHYDTCPLPVANYVMENYVLDTEPYSEMMSEGRWKMEMMLMKGDSVCSGISVLNTVKPKE